MNSASATRRIPVTILMNTSRNSRLNARIHTPMHASTNARTACAYEHARACAHTSVHTCHRETVSCEWDGSGPGVDEDEESADPEDHNQLHNRHKCQCAWAELAHICLGRDPCCHRDQHKRQVKPGPSAINTRKSQRFCMWVCMRACVHACMIARLHTSACLCVHVFTCPHACVSVCVCMCVCVCV